MVLAEARKQSSVSFFIARRSLSTPLIDLIAYYAKSRNRTELHAQASVESYKSSTCALPRTIARSTVNQQKKGQDHLLLMIVLQYGRHKTSEVLASPPDIYCLPMLMDGLEPFP